MNEWKVASDVIGDKKEYFIYKLRNPKVTDHPGNRIPALASYDTKEKAQEMADKWNHIEAEKEKEEK